ncbi:MAG: FecR domain-containing protein [Lachnospiraceae bacterium]|nr:FecR domain-containing protein [Lachnospiraceae bacterium]
MKKTKKLILLIIVIVVLVATVVAILFATGVLGNKDEEYRVVSVESYEGEVKLERNAKEQDMFQGMNLRSEDRVSTGEAASMLLLADSDKYILAEENTCFTLVATGNENNGKISIGLEYGTALITIENKLADGSEFEVDTPNATMSVRGTIFEVTYNEETGETLLTVEEGCVEVVNDIMTKLINAGESVVITDEEILYVDDSNDAEIQDDTELDDDENSDDKEDDEATDTPADLSVLADGVDDEEWSSILKGEADITALEYCLGIMTKCKIDGHENYVAEALIDLDTNIYYKEPFEILGHFQEADFNYEWFMIYYLSDLNNVYGLMNGGTIDESNIPEDAHIVGIYLYLNTNVPEEYCITEGVDMDGLTSYMGENYYLPCPMSVSIDNVDVSQADKIVIEYTFVLSDGDGNVIHDKSPFVAYLEPDASGRYVITTVEKNN